MNIYKMLTLVLVVSLVSACQTSNRNSLDLYQYIPSEQAVVVMQMSHNYDRASLLSDNIDVEGYFTGTWVKMGSDPAVTFTAYPFAGFSQRSLDYARKFEAYVVEPGTYYLNYIKVPTSVETYLHTKNASASSSVLGQLKPLLYMTFTVEAGDIAYIGSPRVEIIEVKDMTAFRVLLDDEYEDAVPYAEQKFPLLKGKIGKKLATAGLSQKFPGKVLNHF